jgi:hypothetical protein
MHVDAPHSMKPRFLGFTLQDAKFSEGLLPFSEHNRLASRKLEMPRI